MLCLLVMWVNFVMLLGGDIVFVGLLGLLMMNVVVFLVMVFLIVVGLSVRLLWSGIGIGLLLVSFVSVL